MTRRSDAYGKTVFKHLQLVKKQLMGEGASKRQGWLRLLKDVADFVAVTKQKGDKAKGNS